jgi:tetratricopeptide (TPR) repeat protein
MVCGVLLFVGAPVPTAAEGVKEAMAKRHFENGAEYYAQADYSAALEEFKKADALMPNPEFKFNIGRCYEGMGKLREAIAAYKRYLEQSTDEKGRASVELRIKNLEKRVESSAKPDVPPEPEKAGGGAAKVDAVDPNAAAPVITERPRKRGSTRRLLGWTAVGVGAAALITAGILGGLSLSKRGEYEDAHADHALYTDARGLLEDSERFEIGSFVTLGVGIAAAAGGVILLLLDRDSSTRRDDVAACPRGRLVPEVTGTGLGFHF